LGKSADFTQIDSSLTAPPAGYDSVHGVRSSSAKKTQFSDDEYVIYSPHQQKMAYLVEFSIQSDLPEPSSIKPRISTTQVVQQQSDMLVKMDDIYQPSYQQHFSSSNYELEQLTDALGLEDKEQEEDQQDVGLISKDGTALPLKGVFVRAQLLGKVVFQFLYFKWRLFSLFIQIWWPR